MRLGWLLGGLVWLAAVGCAPQPEPPKVNGDAAYLLAEKLVGFGRRYSGSAEYRAQSEFIAAEARKAGAEVRFQDFRQQTPKGVLDFRNIIAEVKGRRPEFIVISSHCDLKELPDSEFQGANDGTSSTALLIEMMQAIQRSGQVPPWTLRFVFFDGEECQLEYSEFDGLTGSRFYAKELSESPERQNCLGVFNLDMIGDRELRVMIPANGDAGLARHILTAARAGGAERYFYQGGLEILDDHVPFLGLGIPAVNLIDFEYGPANSYWHTGEDRMDKISGESMEIVGNTVFLAIWTLKK